LPYEATIEDVKTAYYHSWKSMIKANALYRDSSKLSQPLNTTANEWLDILQEPATPQHEKVKQIATQIVREYINDRRPLPGKRVGYTQKVKIGGHNIYLRTGQYEDGKLGEIFLDINKEGTLLRSMMNCFAVAVSMGLQYGVPLDEYVKSFTFARFEPNGLVVGHDNVKRATSIIDFIFRDLAINYLGRHDLAHVAPEVAAEIREEAKSNGRGNGHGGGGHQPKEEVPVVFAKVASAGMAMGEGLGVASEEGGMAFSMSEKAFDDFAQKYAAARMKGYEGDPCPECGSMSLVRNGSCLKCDSCGSTTGCS